MKSVLKLCFCAIIIIFSEMTCAVSDESCVDENHLETEDIEVDNEKESIWEFKPVEIDSVNVQILDKISGKVFRQKIFVNQVTMFGSIKMELRRAFKNTPEDTKEVCAYIKISEKNEGIFSNWLFASSPSVNLPVHPVYDIRVEF